MKRAIQDIYEQYELTPFLRKHQFLVAAVAQQICEHQQEDVETEAIIAACLLHDMGNIVKFDLDNQPKGVELENIDHWKQVQQHVRDTYGATEHAATSAIVREIGVPDRVADIVDAVGFDQTTYVYEANDLAKSIAHYADKRVAPYGVVSQQERLEDGGRRYGYTNQNESPGVILSFKIETIIFETTDITPEAITDASVAPLVDKLQSWHV